MYCAQYWERVFCGVFWKTSIAKKMDTFAVGGEGFCVLRVSRWLEAFLSEAPAFICYYNLLLLY